MRAGLKHAGRLAALILLVLSLSCSGKEETKTTSAQHDGVEIVSLMTATQEAFANNDPEGLAALFAKYRITRPESAWKNLDNLKNNVGELRVKDLINNPEITRADPEKNVNKLAIHLWYDFRPWDGQIYHTTWTFVRGEEDQKWGLYYFLVDQTHMSYGDLMSDLTRIDQYAFNALDMNWEESPNPAPLLDRTIKAMAGEDIETLKSCTLHGTLFYAQSTGVRMPSIDNRNKYGGVRNREVCERVLKEQIFKLKNLSGQLGLTVEELAPFFLTYNVESMPDYCTKIRLEIEYDGEEVPANVGSFTVAWAAGRIQGKWLAESMYIDSIKM